jgi:hypothetical protein
MSVVFVILLKEIVPLQNIITHLHVALPRLIHTKYQQTESFCTTQERKKLIDKILQYFHFQLSRQQ